MVDVCINVTPATFTTKFMYPYTQKFIDTPITVPTNTETPANAITKLGAGINQSSIIKKIKKNTKHLLFFFIFKTTPLSTYYKINEVK